jgi:hypothetical protein
MCLEPGPSSWDQGGILKDIVGTVKTIDNHIDNYEGNFDWVD